MYTYKSLITIVLVITVVLLMAMIIVGVMFGCKYISYIKNKPKHSKLIISEQHYVNVLLMENP